MAGGEEVGRGRVGVALGRLIWAAQSGPQTLSLPSWSPQSGEETELPAAEKLLHLLPKKCK